MIDLEKTSVDRLKVLAYELIRDKETKLKEADNIQAELQKVNLVINKKEAEEALKKETKKPNG